jgi:hypothetical protein
MRMTALAAIFAEIDLEPANFFEPQLDKQLSGGSLGHCVQVYADLFSIRGLNRSFYECRRRSLLPACLYGPNIHEHCRIVVSLSEKSQSSLVGNQQ